MAKSDSFFIRAEVETNGTTFAQAGIDLGAYVDALGKSVLRVHNVQVRYPDIDTTPTGPGPLTASCQYQITTQSQSAIVNLTDKSVVASGHQVTGFDGTLALTTYTDTQDLGPQQWTQGYLIGVEQIYLGFDASSAAVYPSGNTMEIVMECTVETLSSSAAMALALSQQ